MGLGIGTMRGIGMLAFSRWQLFCDSPTLVMSLLAAIGASAVALLILSTRPWMCPGNNCSSIMGGDRAARYGSAWPRCEIPPIRESLYSLCRFRIALLGSSRHDDLDYSFASA
jgi:predicted exporter